MSYVPLIDEEYYTLLKHTKVAYLDANTRFPASGSGHWSITASDPKKKFEKWLNSRYVSSLRITLLAAHSGARLIPSLRNVRDLCWSIGEFVERVRPNQVTLVHYSGWEDREDVNNNLIDGSEAEILEDDTRLRAWIRTHFKGSRWFKQAIWKIPPPGDVFPFYP